MTDTLPLILCDNCGDRRAKVRATVVEPDGNRTPVHICPVCADAEQEDGWRLERDDRR